MHINCFWVSGQFKGHGYANQLLGECIADAQRGGKSGLTVLSSKKKMPFLSDPGYLKYKGFVLADTAKPYFELLYLPFANNAPVPKFKDCAKDAKTSERGVALFYSNQCPYTDKYAPIVKAIAASRGMAVNLHKFETATTAQNAPAPYTTYSLFIDGSFVTNEILSEKKFSGLLDQFRHKHERSI
jgi:predicted GNAT family acetyltransferase